MITRILRLLKRGVPIEQRHIKCWGLCYFDELIVIRVTLCEKSKVTTLIHECIHWLEPDIPESGVRHIEREVFNSLTDKQYGLLVFYLEE